MDFNHFVLIVNRVDLAWQFFLLCDRSRFEIVTDRNYSNFTGIHDEAREKVGELLQVLARVLS